MPNFKRIFKHLTSTRHQVKRAFPARSLNAIEQAIGHVEATHVGEIRFVVEAALEVTPLLAGQTGRERAIEVFSQLRMWDTQHRTGVLIYLLMADRQVDIVADRGIDAQVGTLGWAKLCGGLEAAFHRGEFESGALACIAAVAQQLERHFPTTPDSPIDLANAPADRLPNELPDAPVVL